MVCESDPESNIEIVQLKFDEINDDCLLHIASYLRFIDVVKVGIAFPKLKSFTHQIYREKTHLSFGTGSGDLSINEWNLKPVLQEIGHYIESIEWRDLSPSHLDYLSKYCLNVKALKLISPSKKLNSSAIKRNEVFFSKIEMLDISDASFYDAALKTIIWYTNLESLQVKDCKNGKFLQTIKMSKLKCFKISNCCVVCDEVLDVVRNNNLVKFLFGIWYESDLAFQKTLSLPSECLSHLEELELKYYYICSHQYEKLDFKKFKRLTHFSLTCDFNTYRDCDNFFVAASEIPTLNSLTVDIMEITPYTLSSMGSLKNLRKLRLNIFRNKIGRKFYSNLNIHLPELTELSISLADYVESEWICEMVSSLRTLKYFYYASMDWRLLEMILEERLRLKLPKIEIGIGAELFEHDIKVSATLHSLLDYIRKYFLYLLGKIVCMRSWLY